MPTQVSAHEPPTLTSCCDTPKFCQSSQACLVDLSRTPIEDRASVDGCVSEVALEELRAPISQ
jgi:hypothetical protein